MLLQMALFHFFLWLSNSPWLEEEMATHSSILDWRIHGQRSLVGYSPRGHRESDTPEWLSSEFHGLHVGMPAQSLSYSWLFATPWTLAHQAPLSMEFSRRQYWSGLPFPSPGDLPNLGIKPRCPALQTDALPSEPLGKPKKPLLILLILGRWPYSVLESWISSVTVLTRCIIFSFLLYLP